MISKPRTVYISDEQYAAIYEEATPTLRVAMEVSYLCAARHRDVLEKVSGDVMDADLFIEQNKTGKKQIKEQSPRLRSAFQLARNTMDENGKYVITDANDEKATSRTIDKWRDTPKKPGLLLDAPSMISKRKPVLTMEAVVVINSFSPVHCTERRVLTHDRKMKVTPTLDMPLLSVNS